MKKRTSKVSRRIVSLLMSLVLTLTLVTPAAFATEVVGGSGAGKSRFYAKVNICQCNTSFFILDCKGELLRDCGGLRGLFV